MIVTYYCVESYLFIFLYCFNTVGSQSRDTCMVTIRVRVTVKDCERVHVVGGAYRTESGSITPAIVVVNTLTKSS